MENYPIYRKDPAHFYKVISEERTIQILDCYDDFGIKTIGINCAYLDNSTESSEVEFLQAYNKAKDKLEKIAL